MGVKTSGICREHYGRRISAKKDKLLDNHSIFNQSTHDHYPESDAIFCSTF
jgi:hypothetical protein